MIAIRIEHPDSGNGIWRHKVNNAYLSQNFSFFDDFCNKHLEFPTPNRDSLIHRYIEENEYCAFKSVQQIQQWMDLEWWNEIFEFGYKVYMLELSDCTVGKYQIIFTKNNIISKKDISSLFITK